MSADPPPALPPLHGADLSALHGLLQDGPLVLVVVERTEGSVPREAGSWMAVTGSTVLGTIGGGQLEWQAIASARQQLHTAGVCRRQRHALGPSLGQCCGGVVHLVLHTLGPGDGPAVQAVWVDDRWPVGLFGGGHVGHALVRALSPLPCRVYWFDSRDQVFAAPLPAQVLAEHSDPIERAVADMPAGSQVLIMSFSHAEDLDIVVACLKRLRERADLPFVGLIGSQTKWATFRHRLEDRGFSAEEIAHITCPIGVPGITGKEPEVIAVAVAAQLLQTL